MEFLAKSGAPARQRTSCAIVGIYENGKLSSPAAQLDEAGKHLISKLVAQGDIRGKLGHSLLLTQAPGLGCQRILLMGCGAKKSFDLRKYIQTTQHAAKALANTSIKDAISYLPLQLTDTDGKRQLRRCRQHPSRSGPTFFGRRCAHGARRRISSRPRGKKPHQPPN